MRPHILLLACLVTLLPACASNIDAGAVSDREEPTTGTRITRRDRPSDVKVISREEFERAKAMNPGTIALPKN